MRVMIMQGYSWQSLMNLAQWLAASCFTLLLLCAPKQELPVRNTVSSYSVMFRIVLFPSTAINKDYEHISRNIMFSSDLAVLVKIRIIDDDTVDHYREETFNVMLQNTPGVTQRLKPVRTPVTVVIRDNDGIGKHHATLFSSMMLHNFRALWSSTLSLSH